MNTKTLAWQIRKDAIEMVHTSHASHIGAILSVVDIVAVLYGDVELSKTQYDITMKINYRGKVLDNHSTFADILYYAVYADL